MNHGQFPYSFPIDGCTYIHAKTQLSLATCPLAMYSYAIMLAKLRYQLAYNSYQIRISSYNFCLYEHAVVNCKYIAIAIIAIIHELQILLCSIASYVHTSHNYS